MSKFQYVRVQFVEEEVFRTPAHWDLKDITIDGSSLLYKSKLYILPKITNYSIDKVGSIMIEDDEEAIERYKDEMPDEDKFEEESEEESEEYKKECEAMQKYVKEKNARECSLWFKE